MAKRFLSVMGQKATRYVKCHEVLHSALLGLKLVIVPHGYNWRSAIYSLREMAVHLFD
jgi:hypothetical protein